MTKRLNKYYYYYLLNYVVSKMNSYMSSVDWLCIAVIGGGEVHLWT